MLGTKGLGLVDTKLHHIAQGQYCAGGKVVNSPMSEWSCVLRFLIHHDAHFTPKPFHLLQKIISHQCIILQSTLRHDVTHTLQEAGLRGGLFMGLCL